MDQIMNDLRWFTEMHHNEREHNKCDYSTRVNHIRRLYVFITNPVFFDYLNTNQRKANIIKLIQTIVDNCISLIHELVITPETKTINDQLVDSLNTFVTISQLHGICLFSKVSERDYTKAREHYYQSSTSSPCLRRSERITALSLKKSKSIKSM